MIIERKLAEEALQVAKAQAELYVDLMCHDINNMNQVAMGNLELAVMKLEQNGKLDASDLPLLKASIESLSSSSRLISNVQKLKSTSSEGISLHAVDAVKLMAEAIGESGHKGRDISIEFSHDEKCIVKANALLKDVFANLINNSIKHSRPEKPLAISISIRMAMHDGDVYCRIVVDDNGPGIPDDLKEKLFQRFSRGQTRVKGSGLGLYLAKTLVEHYGGSINVEDRVQGDYTQGARFVIMLPVAEV